MAPDEWQGEKTGTEARGSQHSALEYEDQAKLDVESQHQPHSGPNEATLKPKLLILLAWLLLNFVLTFSNKIVLIRASFPWLLTSVHTSATTIGCFTLVLSGKLKPSRLNIHGNVVMIAFSVLFTANIVASNASLSMVSVPLHQVLRSTCPVAAILLERILGRKYSYATYLSIIPLVIGVGLATAGDYYCTISGLALTVVGVVLAALKTVATNRIVTGSLPLRTMDILLRMSPLATVQCLMWAMQSGEVAGAYSAFLHGDLSWRFGLILFCNGIVAFLLNVVSLQANKVAGALTMTVAGNIKQSLTILLGIVVFQVQTSMLAGAGIFITIAGAVWYSKVELDAKRSTHR